MRIAACQLPDVRKDIDRALSMVEAYTADAERQGAALICFPECFLQGYDLNPEYVAEAAIELRSSGFEHILRSLEGLEPVIVVGLIEREAGKYFNSAVAVKRGTLVAHYRKTHLLNGERSIFQPGGEYAVFDVCGIKVGINICYDLCFAESFEAIALAGAQVVVCPCSNMMSSQKAEEWKHRHNEIRAERAHGAGLWLISSDITGESRGKISYGPTAAIDPSGRVVDQVPLMTTGMIVVQIV